MPQLTAIDAMPKVDEATAALLMVHHLSLAAAYFEATPENPLILTIEIGNVFGNDGIARPAAEAFVCMLIEAYKNFDG